MANIEQVELTVRDKGIHCAGCEARIESVLGRVPGVQRAKADHKTQLVRLTLDVEETSVTDVRAKLDALGFRTAP